MRTVIFNPDDGKQPKTFGLKVFNFTIFNFFNFFSLVYEIHFIERTLWTEFNVLERKAQILLGKKA